MKLDMNNNIQKLSWIGLISAITSFIEWIVLLRVLYVFQGSELIVSDGTNALIGILVVVTLIFTGVGLVLSIGTYKSAKKHSMRRNRSLIGIIISSILPVFVLLIFILGIFI